MVEGKKSGFSLVEVLVVVVLISIITAAISNGVISYAAEKRAEIQVADFFAEFNSFRAKVLKGGAPVITVFDTTTSTYTVFIDSNINSVPDTNELIETTGSPELSFGLPSPSPTSIAPGTDGLSKISESWEDGVVIANNATLTIPSGYLYLQNPSKPAVGYCLAVAPGEAEVKLYKWTGSTWYKY